jgi:hypothetical protein
MKPKRNKGAISIILLLLLFIAGYARLASANDSAAEISASGIQFKEEKNISIEKEELYISWQNIEVSYVFRNHSDKDITVDIAFPVPEYTSDDAQRGMPFDNFVVEVNGQKLKYNTEIRALIDKKDYSNVLKQMGISIRDFGGYSHPLYKNFYELLSEKNKITLLQLGLVNSDGLPMWNVSIKYHWTQTFPADKTTAIRHTYMPWWGYTMVDHSCIDDKSSYLYKDACISDETKKWMKQTLTNTRPISVTIVGYILNTAKNWRTPIKDFHLKIEKNAKAKLGLCFDHKLTKISETIYETHIKNFIPKRNLKVYYFQ